MKRSCTNTGASRHAYYNICCLSPAIMDLCKIIYNLIEAHAYKICKLHFNNTLIIFQCKTKTCAKVFDVPSFTGRTDKVMR